MIQISYSHTEPEATLGYSAVMRLITQHGYTYSHARGQNRVDNVRGYTKVTLIRANASVAP